MPLNQGEKKIGLIAGGGQFPLLICRAARAEGYSVVVAALEGDADPRLSEEADECHWFKLGQLKGIISPFRNAGVSEAVMAGTVTKSRLFSGQFRPDLKFIKTMLPRIVRVHDDSLLRLLADVLADEGITIRESTLLMPSLIAPEGRLTRRKPTKRESKDAAYGFRLAKELGQFDIGQCLVVRSRAVLAVEGMEGTDETILRGGRLGQGRSVVVKVAKPGQDFRFDLPSVGVQTIEKMIEAGCSALVIEAGHTLCFDREEMVARADKAGICILALNPDKALEEPEG